MNYRHAFHAGNFADVVKHATLARVIAHLKEKPAAFRMIDTHAGAGLYDLTGPEATAPANGAPASASCSARGSMRAARDLLGALSRCGRGAQSGRKARSTYPGSPVLAQRWLRTQDRLVCCELEPRPRRR